MTRMIFHDVPKRQSETFSNLENMNSREQAITIQQVSQRLDVPKPTLRFWEREFEGILVPLRTNGGQRRYAPEHVSIIEEIKMLKKAGLSLIEIKRKLGKGQRSEVRPARNALACEAGGGQRSGSMSKAGEQMSGAGSQTCPQRSRHAPHRESQPRRTSLRGGRGSGDERTEGIGLLADRVAEVVKMEVLRFFQGEEG